MRTACTCRLSDNGLIFRGTATSVRVITRDYNIFLQMPGPAIFGSPIFLRYGVLVLVLVFCWLGHLMAGELATCR